MKRTSPYPPSSLFPVLLSSLGHYINQDIIGDITKIEDWSQSNPRLWVASLEVHIQEEGVCACVRRLPSKNTFIRSSIQGAKGGEAASSQKKWYPYTEKWGLRSVGQRKVEGAQTQRGWRPRRLEGGPTISHFSPSPATIFILPNAHFVWNSTLNCAHNSTRRPPTERKGRHVGWPRGGWSRGRGVWRRGVRERGVRSS